MLPADGVAHDDEAVDAALGRTGASATVGQSAAETGSARLASPAASTNGLVRSPIAFRTASPSSVTASIGRRSGR